MKRKPSIPAGASSVASARNTRPGRIRNILAAVIKALHHSRQQQAERVLHEYRHLAHRPEHTFLSNQIPEDTNNQQPCEDTSRHTLPVRRLVFVEKLLIAALLTVFIVLHVLADSFMRRAEVDNAVSEQDFRSQIYD